MTESLYRGVQSNVRTDVGIGEFNTYNRSQISKSNCNIVCSGSITSKVSPILYYQNICSLANKIDDLEVIIDTFKPDGVIVCLTEHWMTKNSIDSAQLKGYKLASAYCRNTLRCGGVCIFILNNVEYDANLEMSSLSVDLHFECAAIKINWKSMFFTVIVLYRSPKGSFDIFIQKLDTLLSSINCDKENVLICGDFNVDLANDSAKGKSLLNIFTIFNFHALVHSPTRESVQRSSMLDNIFTNYYNPDINLSCTIVQHDISDHHGLILNCNNSLMHKKQSDKLYSESRNFSMENLILVSKTLAKVNLNNLLHENNVCEAYSNLLTHITSAINFSCNTRKIFHKPSNWINDEVRRLRALKIDLFSVWKRDSSEHSRIMYTTFVKFYKKEIKTIKSEYIMGKINKAVNKPKALWGEVRSLTKRAIIHTNYSLTIDGVICDDPYKVANVFNTEFVHVSNKINGSLNVLTNGIITSKTNVSMFWIPVTAEEVSITIKKMKNKLSIGPDHIPISVIKFCTDYLSPFLADLFNISFERGIVPADMKVSKVIPLYKKGDKLNPNNYRPIALPSWLTKIFETLVKDRLVAFLDSNKLFSIRQFGFRNNSSTIDAIINHLNSLLEAIENGNTTFSIYCDMSKAFDLVNHDKLLEILEAYGVRGIVLKWFQSYLSNRSQYVELKHSDINGCIQSVKSATAKVLTGVPQGSVLGPVLFILYINHLPKNVEFVDNIHSTLFADDFSIHVNGKIFNQVVTNVNLVLEKVAHCLSDLSLVVNASKTFYMSFNFGPKLNDVPALIYNDAIIKRANSHSFLGVIIDDNLSWNIHVDKLVNNLCSACYIIKTIKKYITLEAALQAYHCYFKSIMTYGILLWGNSSQQNHDRVFKLQKRAIRYLCNVNQRHSCRKLFRQLNVLTLTGHLIYELALYIRKNLDLFIINSNVHNHDTRIKDQLHIEYTRLTIYKKCPKKIGILVYNRLPRDILQARSLLNFKNSLKSYLIVNSFYNIDEFFS